VFNHLQAAFRRRLGVADQGECPLVLDLGLIVVDGVGGFDLEGSGFAGEGIDEDLHYLRGDEERECLPCPGSWP